MLNADLVREAHALIADRIGLDMPADRLGDVESAIAAAAAASSVDCAAYLGRLRMLPSDRAPWRRLASALTVGETYFFRDIAAFDALERYVLPELIAERRSQGALRLRIWSAGCATGEEPYSLAILLHRLLPDLAQWSLTILGTDINATAIETAERGFYREWALRATPAEVRRRYFERRGGEFRLDPEIRGMVTFAPLNLVEPLYPDTVTNTTAMDLVLCRNVIMYFTPRAQREVVGRLARALTIRGWLALSAAESSAESFSSLRFVAFPGAVFYRRDAGSPFRAAETERNPLREEGDSPRSTGLGMTPPAPAIERPSLERARALADAGRLDEARQICRTLLGTDRLNAAAHVLLAAIHQELGDIGPAMEALRAAIYLTPESPAAHFLLGVLQLRQGDRPRGLRTLQTSIDLLERMQTGAPLPDGGDLTAGRLKEMALAYLEER